MPATPKAEDPPAEPDKKAGTVKTEGGDGSDKSAKKTGINERFSEMAAQRREAEARADRAVKVAEDLGTQLKDAIQTIKDLGGKQAAQVIKDEERNDPRPKRDQFDNPDAFETALVEWANRSRDRQAKAEAEAKRLENDEEKNKKTPVSETPEQKTFRETAERIGKAWADQKKDFLKANPDFLTEHPDFEEVTGADDVKISLAMAESITEQDNGPTIAYYLGQNKEEADRIAGLTPLRQAVEITKISQKLAGEAKPKTSKAPPPVKPLGGTNAATSRTLNDVGNDPNGMNEYAAMRMKQIREERTRH